MNEPPDFDAIAWINTYFRGSVQLSFEQLRPVLCFSLIWNLFETHACGCSADAKSIKKSVDHADQSGQLRRDKYERFLDFFRTRYLSDNQIIDWLFDRFLLTDPVAQEVVRCALVEESQDLNNNVYALLLIAHRIRNNLFHGNKKVELLPHQTELFQTVNELLATYLEDIENLPEKRPTNRGTQGQRRTPLNPSHGPDRSGGRIGAAP